MTKRKIGDIWKATGEKSLKSIEWKVQFPNGIMTFKTKREALNAIKVFNL